MFKKFNSNIKSIQSKTAYLPFTLLLIGCNQAFCAPAPVAMPAFQSCVANGVAVQGQNLNVAKPKTASALVLLMNNSQQNITVTHPVVHPSASAGWYSQIQPGQCSLLLVSALSFAANGFQISCSQTNNQGSVPLNCNKVLKACAIQPFKLVSPGSNGSYWVQESVPCNQITKLAAARGVVF